MALRNYDRFASPDCRRLQVGDVVRLPLTGLGGDHRMERLDRHPWIVVAFPIGDPAARPTRWCHLGQRALAHCVILRRLGGTQVRLLSQVWAAMYVDAPSPCRRLWRAGRLA